MKSVIINMADRIKDAQDRKLEALFATDPVRDDGFSVRIQRRIQRKLWVRRLALPVAVLIGGAIAAKPMAGLLAALIKVASVIPGDLGESLGSVSASDLPQFSTFILGGMLALVFVMATRMLED